MFKVYSMTEIDDKNQSQNNYYINKLVSCYGSMFLLQDSVCRKIFLDFAKY